MNIHRYLYQQDRPVGVDLQSVVQSVRDKLSADIIIKTVSLSPEIVLEENTDIEAWDAVIENNDELLEKYIAGEPISRENLRGGTAAGSRRLPVPAVYHGSAKNGLGIQPLMDAVTGLFQPIGEQGAPPLCGSVFKVEYTDCGQRRVYLRLYSERCACGYGGPGRERKAENHRCVFHPKGKLFGQTPLIRVKLLSFPATA